METESIPWWGHNVKNKQKHKNTKTKHKKLGANVNKHKIFNEIDESFKTTNLLRCVRVLRGFCN